MAVVLHNVNAQCPEVSEQSLGKEIELASALFAPHLPAEGTALRRIYLRIALKYHPDKRLEKERPAATRLFQAIGAVYEDLSKGKEDGKTNERMNMRVRNPVAAAAELGDLVELRKLLEESPEDKVNVPDDLGVYPIMFAAVGGCVDAAALLLQFGADLRAVNHINWSVLLYAALGDHAEMVQFLIARGAEVTSHELILTAFTGNSHSLRVLIAGYHGEIGAIRTNESGKTLLHLACEGVCFLKRSARQHAECVHMLLAAGIPIDAPAKDLGRTCLQNYIADVRWRTRNFEASAVHMEVLEALCSHGASVALEDADGATALTLAMNSGLSSVREILMLHA